MSMRIKVFNFCTYLPYKLLCLGKNGEVIGTAEFRQEILLIASDKCVLCFETTSKIIY